MNDSIWSFEAVAKTIKCQQKPLPKTETRFEDIDIFGEIEKTLDDFDHIRDTSGSNSDFFGSPPLKSSSEMVSNNDNKKAEQFAKRKEGFVGTAT